MTETIETFGNSGTIRKIGTSPNELNGLNDLNVLNAFRKS